MAARNPCVRYLLKTVGWFPIVMITAILLWSYYAYIYELCINTVKPIAVQVVLIILFHILYLLLFVSFYRTVFAPLGHPPAQFHLPDRLWMDYSQAATDDFRQRILLDLTMERSLPVHTRQHDNAIRVCTTCRLIKPDRAHHCSICDRCNLKMDHHCPWVNTCVNFKNYKFFILFLGYACIFTLFVILSVIKYAIDVWREGLNDNGVDVSVRKINIVLLPFIALVFCGSAAALFFYHLWLLAKNQTTIEQGRPPIFDNGHVRYDGFSMGHMFNIKQVMGPSCCLWLLPIFNSVGDGLLFPSKYIKGSQSERFLNHSQLENGHELALGNGNVAMHNGHVPEDVNIAIENV